jgi:hypothetical protein
VNERGDQRSSWGSWRSLRDQVKRARLAGGSGVLFWFGAIVTWVAFVVIAAITTHDALNLLGMWIPILMFAIWVPVFLHWLSRARIDRPAPVVSVVSWCVGVLSLGVLVAMVLFA